MAIPRPAPTGDLDPALTGALDGFAAHLGRQRGLSRHTVRAYVGDVTSLLRYAGRRRVRTLADIDLDLLRGWLADMDHSSGAAASSLVRRLLT